MNEIVSIMATRIYICNERSVSIVGTGKKASVVNGANVGVFLRKTEEGW